MDKNTLSQPVTELKGVGNKVAERLQKLGIWQVQDLLFHLPLRYQDRTRLLPLGSLRSHQEGLVEGSVKLSQVKFGRRRSLLCHIEDGTGSLVLRFFHFSKVQQQRVCSHEFLCELCDHLVQLFFGNNFQDESYLLGVLGVESLSE